MLNKQGTHKISAVFPEIKGYKTSYCFILKRYFKAARLAPGSLSLLHSRAAVPVVAPLPSYLTNQSDCHPHTDVTERHLQSPATTAVRFLTRTFCNVFYVCVAKRYVRLWRLQRSRMVVWGG